MSARKQHRAVTPPPGPVVDPLGSHGLGEIRTSSASARCRHRPGCLTPLRVGELVAAVDGGWALLDHVDSARAAAR